jgi:hypothetical protein
LEHRERLLPHEEPITGTLTVVVDSHETGESHTSVYQNANELVRYYLQGYQITDTESHPDWIRRNFGRFHGDIGGPFASQKWKSHGLTRGSSYFYEKHDVDEAHPNGRYETTITYDGPLLPLAPNEMNWPTVNRSSDSSLDDFGATAISRCSPSNPSVDLGETIGEIFKEGIPALLGGTLRLWRGLSNRERRKAIGGEYLNYQFGWRPFVNDLMNFCSGVVDADGVFKRYEANSGKMVRRSYHFPEQKTTDIRVVEENISPWYSPSTTGLIDSSVSVKGTVYRTDQVSIRRWFSGAFIYYVPPPSDGIRNEMARAVIYARKTLGISLTPDTLWNLAPWSWAFDWFSNTGDMLSNWTDWAIDNQVLLYGYVMEHIIHTRTYSYIGATGMVGSSVPHDVVFVVETKTRRQATPYGFGLDWESFSPRQLAIIAALGLSRS